MGINIPPSVFGSAELYTEDDDFAANTTPKNEEMEGRIIQPIYGAVRSIYIDFISTIRVNEDAIHDNKLASGGGKRSMIQVSNDNGDNWVDVLNLEGRFLTGMGATVNTNTRYYGTINIATIFDFTTQQSLRFRIYQLEAEYDSLAFYNSCLCIRVSNIVADVRPT